MGEWGWPIFGYIITLVSLGTYTTWLFLRLRRVQRQVKELS